MATKTANSRGRLARMMLRYANTSGQFIPASQAQLVIARRLTRYGLMDRHDDRGFELTTKGYDYVASGAANEHEPVNRAQAQQG